MNKKHTAGPWRAVDGTKVDIERIFVDCPTGVICRITNEVSKLPLTEEDSANAHLIAASPDLLRALELAVHHAGCPDEWLSIAKDAIRKANN